MIGVRDGRGPCNKIAGERCQISLWKWSLRSDRILYKKDGHNRETICLQIKWGSAEETSLRGVEVKLRTERGDAV